MGRDVTALVLLLAIGVPGLGQQRQPRDPIRLALAPAELPKPSLTYRLLPDQGDLVAGNAAALYYRSLAMFVENSRLLQDLRGEHWSEWLTMSLQELPRQEVKASLDAARSFLREVETAAKRRQCDWELDGRPEGLALLLPEVQAFRLIGMVLAVKVRYEIAEGNFHEALQALQVGFSLARHLGQGPTLIHGLVGMAILNQLIGPLEELLQQPGSPNLYWALTVLPRPYFDFGHALQEEKTMLDRMLPDWKRLNEGPMTPAQVEALQVRLRHRLDDFGLRRPTPQELQNQAVLEAAALVEAKKGLRDQKFPAERLQAMPAYQIIALHAWREYHQTWDEYVKWVHVANFWREPEYHKATKKFEEAVARLDLLFFRKLLSGLGLAPDPLTKVYKGSARLERRFAALRCLEGVRAYAAGHEGNLSPRLQDITEVPVPLDPITGQAFEYKVEGKKARLAGLQPAEDQLLPDQTVIYEVTIKR